MLKHVVKNHSTMGEPSTSINVQATYSHKNKTNDNNIQHKLNSISNSTEEISSYKKTDLKKENHSNTIYKYLLWVGSASLTGLLITTAAYASTFFNTERNISYANEGNDNILSTTRSPYLTNNRSLLTKAFPSLHDMSSSTLPYSAYSPVIIDSPKKNEKKVPTLSKVKTITDGVNEIVIYANGKIEDATIKIVNDSISKSRNDFFSYADEYIKSVKKENEKKQVVNIDLYDTKKDYGHKTGSKNSIGRCYFMNENEGVYNEIVTFIKNKKLAFSIYGQYTKYLNSKFNLLPESPLGNSFMYQFR